MKLTIVYDNTTTDSNLIAHWGFSCFIKYKGKNILFDTGGNGRFLIHNLKHLNISPESMDHIVVSHPHFDHIGGLSEVLNENKGNAKLHLPMNFRGVKFDNEIFYYDSPAEIEKGIYVSGEIDNIEQALAIKTRKGLAMIVGCSHPGIKPFIDTLNRFGNIHTIIGGFHNFNDFEMLKDLTKICPTHCTKNADEIIKRFPEKIIKGGVGRIFEVI
ncbi:MBL fold metallo-hydrolase [Candidatus Woesearchaeota archaeon]|nr:MAG: MBL fold metallo-hydrolase [Candidatus Woesearchaeota archaeon]